MLFFLGEIMEFIKNKEKDEKKVWVDTHTFYKDRKCGSGVTFSGIYKKNKSQVNKVVRTCVCLADRKFILM